MFNFSYALLLRSSSSSQDLLLDGDTFVRSLHDNAAEAAAVAVAGGAFRTREKERENFPNRRETQRDSNNNPPTHNYVPFHSTVLRCVACPLCVRECSIPSTLSGLNSPGDAPRALETGESD